jgi:hypothetical protein
MLPPLTVFLSACGTKIKADSESEDKTEDNPSGAMMFDANNTCG